MLLFGHSSSKRTKSCLKNKLLVRGWALDEYLNCGILEHGTARVYKEPICEYVIVSKNLERETPSGWVYFLTQVNSLLMCTWVVIYTQIDSLAQQRSLLIR